MKAKELMRIIRKAGGRLVRTRGDHWIYKFQNGMVFSLPSGGCQTEVSTGRLGQARKVFRANSLPVTF